MAILEFGYSRSLVFWTDYTTVYLQSLSVSGIPMETDRYDLCSVNVTESGAAPINPQPVTTTCSPTAAPTIPSTTMDPTNDSTLSPSASQNRTTKYPTTDPISSQSPTITATATQNATTKHPTASIEQTNESMITFVSVGSAVGLCILLLLTCLYFKREQNLKSDSGSAKANVNGLMEESVPRAPREEAHDENNVAVQTNAARNVEMYVEQQARITANGGNFSVHVQRQSVSESDGMYVGKDRRNGESTKTATGGDDEQYADEGVSDDVNGEGDNAENDNTPQTRTKGDSIAGN
eukprot:CAMPEP_0197042788 /NCGR_PEP_ID=MMETSP1384-20130603/19114_1 /TAXON_ID=29189 /ORGANISM="Ammonia sp." /LENGTH=293 /DNA_ID=CAMNT_0042473963 /DNA_START=30 /DNA_END=911 /DNA_ORIENTATION=-